MTKDYAKYKSNQPAGNKKQGLLILIIIVAAVMLVPLIGLYYQTTHHNKSSDTKKHLSSQQTTSEKLTAHRKNINAAPLNTPVNAASTNKHSKSKVNQGPKFEFYSILPKERARSRRSAVNSL